MVPPDLFWPQTKFFVTGLPKNPSKCFHFHNKIAGLLLTSFSACYYHLSGEALTAF